jgi:Ser/Thr protein kinase RdoA (MazF antagonist)
VAPPDDPGAAGARRLPSGQLSRVYALDGPDEPVVVKLGPPALLRREASALRAMEGLAACPRVVADGPGVLVLSLLPGATLSPSAIRPARARALGAAVRGVHESLVTPTGAWPGWEREAPDLAGYHAAIAAAMRDLAPARHAAATAAVLDALPPLPPGDARGFRRLHGDLWSGNVVWDGDRPAFVDWEYSRQGDPAEELAYVIEMDALEPPVVDALLDGYGPPELAARVAAWRPLTAVAAGLWYADVGLEDRATALLRQAAALTRAAPRPG